MGEEVHKILNTMLNLRKRKPEKEKEPKFFKLR